MSIYLLKTREKSMHNTLVLIYILLGTTIIASFILTHLYGLLTNLEKIKKFDIYAISYSAGILLATSFHHLLPESYKKLIATSATMSILVGFILFFAIETIAKYLKARHPEIENSNTIVIITAITESMHSIISGIAISIGFIHSTKIGLITLGAIAINMIPLLISNIAIYTNQKAKKSTLLIINITSTITLFAGSLLTYFFHHKVATDLEQILAFIAGGFLYLGATKLIPQVQKQTVLKNLVIQTGLLLIGIATIVISDILIQKIMV